MTVRPDYRGRTAAFAVAIVCASVAIASWTSLPARAQQSGTVLRDTITFAGTDTATIDIVVAGPRPANSVTILSLEFGRDGAGIPGMGPAIPDSASFTVSSAGHSKVFHPNGRDGRQPFPNKQVNFSRPDPGNRPNLFALAVVHHEGIAPDASERWTLTIAGLPAAGLRANGSVTQGEFAFLSPAGVGQVPVIRITPAPVAQGTSPSLAVTSSGDFNLSDVDQAQIEPFLGVSNIRTSSEAPGGITITFDLARCARGGNRRLELKRGDVIASAPFTVTPLPPPTISLSEPIVRPGTSPSISVSASECFDLSADGRQVSITPRDGITRMDVTDVTPRSIVLSLSIASTAPEGVRTVAVTTPDGSATATFTVTLRQCPIGQHCCAFDGDTCTQCRVQCPHPHTCPTGQHCCEEDDQGNCTDCRTGHCELK